MCFFYNFIRFLGRYTLFLQPVSAKREQSVIFDPPVKGLYIY